MNVTRMHTQLDYFKAYQRRMTALIGATRTKRLVNQALFLMTVGGNDFVNNYYLVPSSARSRQYSLPQYVKLLICEYRKHLQVKLYIQYFLFLVNIFIFSFSPCKFFVFVFFILFFLSLLQCFSLSKKSHIEIVFCKMWYIYKDK